MIRLLFFFAGLVALIAGCAGAPPIKIDTLAARNMAAIQSENNAATITNIDGQKTQSFFRGGTYEAELTPAEHLLSIYYPGNPNQMPSGFYFKLLAEAGHLYRIKA